MKLKRRIMQWTAVAVVLAAVYFLFLNDVARSLAWHWAHGSTVTYQGHTMTLPLLWRQKDSSGTVLELSRAAFVHPIVDAGLSGPESLTIAPYTGGPAGIDDGEAERWQDFMVASFKAGGNFASPEKVRSKSMTFYCFNRDDGSTHGGCLDCRATGTNWEAVFGVGDGGAGTAQGQLQEAREILKSVQ